jgi:hypothetical protein
MWIMGCLVGHHEIIARAAEMKLCKMMKEARRSNETLKRSSTYRPHSYLQFTDRRVRSRQVLMSLHVRKTIIALPAPVYKSRSGRL